MQHRILAIAFFFLGLTATSSAAPFEEVASDFKPLSGYIVMQVNAEFLIDQDADKGVTVGDLFTIVSVGEKIIHPITHEVIGTLDQTKGFLRVTRLDSGFSYAQPIGKSNDFKPGDIIRRYDNIPAIFWDYTGHGKLLFARLKDDLPHLNWQDYNSAQTNRPDSPSALLKQDPALLFILDETGLHVHDSSLRIIHSYQLPGSPIKTPRTGVEVTTVNQSIDTGFQTISSLPDGATVSAFTKTGDRLLLASTDGNIFQIFTVSDAVSPLTQRDDGIPGKILALHWWQPIIDGPLYLAVTSSVERNQAATVNTTNTISGTILELQGDQLLPVSNNLPYLLGSFDRDGDGFNETLLGQNFDRDIFFGSRINELSIINGKLEARRSTLVLPRAFPVQGSLLADLTGDGRPEAIFVRRRVLSIYDGKQLLYESSQQMGGSLSSMTFDRNPDAVDLLFSTEPFEVSPVAVDLDGDGQVELVAISAEGSFLRAPGIGPNISKAWLSVFRYSNNTFVRGRIGDDLENPIQGLAVDEGRVLLVNSKGGAFTSSNGNSHLLALPLN